jgi:GGDEF domain-containing protein
MATAVGRDLLGEFSNAVAAYLNVMAVTADCLEQTYPDVGGPYRQRIQRLRSRVAFDATREAIKDSAQTMEAELKDFAGVANRVLSQRSVELKSGILDLGDTIEGLAQRQELFANQLRELASQIESAAYPADPQSFSETAALQASSIRNLVQSMSLEAASMVTEMRAQMTELDHRLAGAASTDAATGLVNRRELERQIEALKLHGNTFSILLFDLSGPLSDQVLRMAAAKLVTKFRHTDWIGRWSDRQFAVVFMGEPKMAEMRAAQAIPDLEGHYTLENGERVLIAAQMRLLQPEFAMS